MIDTIKSLLEIQKTAPVIRQFSTLQQNLTFPMHTALGVHRAGDDRSYYEKERKIAKILEFLLINTFGISFNLEHDKSSCLKTRCNDCL